MDSLLVSDLRDKVIFSLEQVNLIIVSISFLSQGIIRADEVREVSFPSESSTASFGIFLHHKDGRISCHYFFFFVQLCLRLILFSELPSCVLWEYAAKG